jgi:hypothetical protein
MESGVERLDLLHQGVSQAVSGDERNTRDIVNGLFGVKLGALPADFVENIDEVRFDIEQTELEYSEQTHWPRPDDQNIGLNGLTHTCHPGTDRAPRSQ